jgi:predicted NBD/HSP70 family sugar kinase
MKLLVIDIGGTFIKYAVMQEDMSTLSRGKVPTPQSGRDALIETIGQLYDTCSDVEGISISMPGIIDSARGYCVTGGALMYNDGFPLREALSRRCPVPIHIANDAKCAAMAEASVGSLKGAANGLVLLFGTMIGGGIILNHEVYMGGHFSAGEVSYIIPRPDRTVGFDNVWGNCCGTPRLCHLYAEKKGIDDSMVDGVMVFDAVHQGDPDALESLKQFTHDIAVQIFSLQTVLDPELVAIGGGISAQPIFLDYIRDNLRELYGECPYQIPQAKIVPCKFFNDANLIGALQYYLSTFSIV